MDHEPRSFVTFSNCVLLMKTTEVKEVHQPFPVDNGNLPAFLSLTGHLLQNSRGEAMQAETLLLCAGVVNVR
jgi:hypothetical protein